MEFNKEAGKALIQSKAFWGAMVTLVALFDAKFAQMLGESIDSILILVGSIFAIYGRYAATKQITGVVSAAAPAVEPKSE
jgi:hypothetical protein